MNDTLPNYLQSLSNYFNSGATLSYEFRKKQLQLLKSSVLDHENEIYTALYSDLKKNKEESWVTEIGFLIAEINHTLKHLYLQRTDFFLPILMLQELIVQQPFCK